MTDIVILGGARTAIGTFGGSLAAIPPIELGTIASKAALERSGVDGAQIGHVAFGHVINTEPRDMYLSRVAAIQAGVPDSAPAMNVNRLCGSGAQAIVSVVQSYRARSALGLENGRCPDAGYDAWGAELSLWHWSYGGDSRKCFGRACYLPCRARCVCNDQSNPRCGGH